VTDPAVAALAQALAAAAGSEEELAGLARAEAIAGRTGRLRAAVALLRAAAAGDEVGVPAPGSATLFHVGRLVRRDEVLEALYEADLRAAPPDTAALDEVGAALAQGVWEEVGELDRALGEVATDWRVERMPVVDRSILRLALWELRHRTGLPAGVIISEAVRLAKAYSTERSGAFVNGVLGHLAAGRGID